jgi:hypothetical protein
MFDFSLLFVFSGAQEGYRRFGFGKGRLSEPGFKGFYRFVRSKSEKSIKSAKSRFRQLIDLGCFKYKRYLIN